MNIPIQLVEKRAEVSTLRPYGKIEVKLSNYLTERGIMKNSLADSIGVKSQTIAHCCKTEDILRLDMILFAKICCSLQCEIADLLEYIPLDKESSAFTRLARAVFIWLAVPGNSRCRVQRRPMSFISPL